ncbi:MAG: hypothetical protein WC879_14490 [Melioribacteraceae bacterium]
MFTIKHKTIILFLFGLLAIAIITFNGCTAAVGTRSHHEKRIISTH